MAVSAAGVQRHPVRQPAPETPSSRLAAQRGERPAGRAMPARATRPGPSPGNARNTSDICALRCRHLDSDRRCGYHAALVKPGESPCGNRSMYPRVSTMARAQARGRTACRGPSCGDPQSAVPICLIRIAPPVSAQIAMRRPDPFRQEWKCLRVIQLSGRSAGR